MAGSEAGFASGASKFTPALARGGGVDQTIIDNHLAALGSEVAKEAKELLERITSDTKDDTSNLNRLYESEELLLKLLREHKVTHNIISTVSMPTGSRASARP